MNIVSKLSILGLLVTGCTFSPPQKDARIILDIEKPLGKNLLTSAAAADCFAVNVVGPGIPDAIPALAKTDLLRLLAGQTKCSAPGVSSGLVNGIGSSTIELQVPTGPDRFIQVVGIEFPAGSPFTSCNTGMNLGEMIAYADSLNLPDGVDSAMQMFHLGQVRKGIFNDQEVQVPNTYDPTNPISLNDCNSDPGIPLRYQGLKFWGDLSRDETLVCSGGCTSSSDILELKNLKDNGYSLVGSSTTTPTFYSATFPNSENRNVAFFDGSDDYWHANNTGLFSSSANAFTFMIIYRMISDGPAKTLASFGPMGNIYTSADHIRLWKDNAAPGSMFLEAFKYTASSTVSRNTGVLPVNVWLTDTYVGSSGNGIQSYRNGIFTGSSIWPAGSTLDLSGRMGIGCFYEDGVGCDPATSNFDGEVAEIIAFDRELFPYERLEIECRIKQTYGIAVSNALCP